MTLTGWNVFTQKDGNAPLLTGLSSTTKPAAPPDKWLLFETDTGKGYYSSGGAWILATGGGGGTVTAVTASAPLASSGGTTPDISLTVPSDATKFLDGTGSFDTVKDSDLSTSNITTNNVTIAKHGFAPILPNDATKYLDGTGAYTVPAGTGTGTVTTTGSPASGNLTKFTGATSISNTDLTGDVTTSGTVATTIANNAVVTAKILDANVTYAKIQDVTAASRLLGRGSASGSGDVEEIIISTGLTLTGTTLTASGGSGTVTTTGSPASGNLSKFSGATSITNADLTGDVTTSGTVAATIANDAVTYAKMQNAAANTIIARAASSSGDLSEVALSASQLAGRGSTGDVAAITLGAGLTMSGTTLSGYAGQWVQLAEAIMVDDTVGTVTFNSIASTYRHLVVIGRGRDTNTGVALDNFIRFNNDSGSNYDRQYFLGTGATTAVGVLNAQTKGNAGIFPGSTSGRSASQGQFEILIPWYSSNAFEKTGVSTLGSVGGSGGTGIYVGTQVVNWINNAVITRIDLLATDKFKNGSAFELYGII